MKSNWRIVAVYLFMGSSAFAQELASTEAEKSTVVDSVYERESFFVENEEKESAPLLHHECFHNDEKIRLAPISKSK